MAPVLEPSQHSIAQLHLPADPPHRVERAGVSTLVVPEVGETTSTAIHITSNTETTEMTEMNTTNDGAGSYVTVIDIG